MKDKRVRKAATSVGFTDLHGSFDGHLSKLRTLHSFICELCDASTDGRTSALQKSSANAEHTPIA